MYIRKRTSEKWQIVWRGSKGMKYKGGFKTKKAAMEWLGMQDASEKLAIKKSAKKPTKHFK